MVIIKCTASLLLSFTFSLPVRNNQISSAKGLGSIQTAIQHLQHNITMIILSLCPILESAWQPNPGPSYFYQKETWVY